MIKAVFYRNPDKTYMGFSLEGHAGYAAKGRDILCSAVTALSFNTVNSIEALTDNKTKVEAERSGSLKFRFESPSDDKGQLLIQSLVLGLTDLYKEYGDRFIGIYFKEV
ncbi:MAG: ribosomal-processing cysteine protease Prp [Lachnospiraceae bacterium]|nr:ribosomal-processing cysteine protease Prp [Lachnospiraceae bacterium]